MARASQDGVRAAFRDYCAGIERIRNCYLCKDNGPEDFEARYAMVQRLGTVIPDGAEWLDVLSGDGVVPGFFKFMERKAHGSLGNHSITCLDNDPEKALALMRMYAERLGYECPRIVNANAYMDDFPRTVAGKNYNVATLIDAMQEESMPLPLLVFVNTARVAPRVEAVQVREIRDPYIKSLKAAGFHVDGPVKENGIFVVGADLRADQNPMHVHMHAKEEAA